MPTRPATGDDLPAIAEIYRHYVETSVATFELDPPDGDEWARRFAAIADAGLPFLVTERDGHVAGYAYCAAWKTRPAYRSTVEDSIYLSPAATGKGIGRALMARMLDDAKAAGIKEVIAVIADRGADASIAMHEKFGFTKIGEMGKVGFKFGRWLGTVLMQKSLKTRKAKP